MDHAITVGEVVWVGLAVVGVLGVLGVIGWILTVIGQGFSR